MAEQPQELSPEQKLDELARRLVEVVEDVLAIAAEIRERRDHEHEP